MERCSTGSTLIDIILEGGLENEVTTTIYGPSGSGKTNIAILAALYNAKSSKIIFIDTEGGFSIDRVKQMFPDDHERRLKNLIIFKPTTFKEQTELFRTLENFSEEHKPKLIVVDSLSMLYRLELGEREAYEVNKEMARQLSTLRKISHKLTIPILLTNQVYANFERKNDIKMVGGDLMKYTSKCIIKLELSETGRILKLLKHRSIPIKEVQFKITQTNIEESTGNRKFSLF